ncbi:hypothetical protein BX661DRAFT_179159 [Kickxella alabastrina]|uniref:uncharacterized protein n=1 Tax=Kickxella alabastrina TaxID=61397 RepID=UPI002220A99D|nr:uncharacterized protein BX661DRAFT_179159 [Kickxella alabastrina]KAI7833095.1 hypothetical protein BX661DRAFT_179159 [Kickxella alabastrina]
MGLIGTLTHASFDIVLIAVCLAGIRRSTGLTLQTNYLSSKNYRRLFGFVIGVGESLFDISVAFMAAYPTIFRRQDPRLPPVNDDSPSR